MIDDRGKSGLLRSAFDANYRLGADALWLHVEVVVGLRLAELKAANETLNTAWNDTHNHAQKRVAELQGMNKRQSELLLAVNKADMLKVIEQERWESLLSHRDELKGALRDLIKLIDESEPDFALIGEDFPELNKARALAKLGTGGGE